MATTPLKTISEALKLIDAKKENLRKAFEDVQSNSSSLSSFTLSWSDLDSHFTSIQSSLTNRFHHLQTLTDHDQSTSPSTSKSVQQLVTDTVNGGSNGRNGIDSTSTSKTVSKRQQGKLARPELKKLCEEMDGIGLREYIMERPNHHASIGGEISNALTYASDAAKLVLDAIEGVVHVKSSSAVKKNRARNVPVSRRIDVLLLEGLVGVVKKDEISGQVKERAKKLLAVWKGSLAKESKEGKDGECSFEALGILHLLDSFGLVNECAVEELVDLIVQSAKYRGAFVFCRELGLVDKVPDIIQRLVETGKPSLAAKFIFEFKLTHKFPPVPILKAHVKNAKKEAQEIRKNGNRSQKSHNEAIDKEVGALRSVLRIIKEHKLESEYPTMPIEKRIESADRQRKEGKRASTFQLNSQQNQNNNKRLVTKPLDTSTPTVLQSDTFVNSTALSFQPPHPQPAGVLLNQPDPYLVPPTSSYGLGANPYLGSSSGTGLLATPNSSLMYSSESHVPPAAYYNMPTAYAGHNLPPEYIQGFYPPR